MDEQKILRAILFAMEKHKGQIRKASGLPYICHLHGAANFLRAFKKSKNITDLMCAVYLHDTLEDTNCTHDELEREFGTLVRSLVQEVTNDPDTIKNQYNGSKRLYLLDKMKGMSSYALVIKLCDRLDNVIGQPSQKTIEHTRWILSRLPHERHLTATHKLIIQRIWQVIGE